MTYHVMRKPCFPEDEGQTELVGTYPSIRECEDEIDDQTLDGYYKKSDFYITQQMDIEEEANRASPS